MQNQLVIGIVSYVLGVITGYLVRTFVGKDTETRNGRMIVLLVVTAIWATSMAVELLNPVYHTNPMVHGLMGSIVGFFYKFEPKAK